jgi:hypothetical protein
MCSAPSLADHSLLLEAGCAGEVPYEKLTLRCVSAGARGKVLFELISASQPRDQLQVLGIRHAHHRIDFEVTDPSVVADATLVNQSQTNKPLHTPADRRRRTKFQQEQPLDRQRASSFLVIADLGNKHTIERGLKVREMFSLECLKFSELLKHAP